MRVDSRPRTQLSGPVGLTILVVLVVVCGLAACGLITGPLPPGAERFAPPAVYARWWSMTEACSGHSGDLRVVRWYRVPGMGLLHEGQEVSGFWGSSPNRIVLADEVIDEGSVVRHEMLHALLQKTGHPRSQFLGACASVVTCPSACVEDAGRWHPPQENYVVVPSESLEVASGIELRPPEADGQRWLALEVSVRNPVGQAASVAAPGDSLTRYTFGVSLRGSSGGISGSQKAADSSSLFFEPFETKRWLYEFKVASDLDEFHVIPGSYFYRGGYAWHWTAFDTITVTP
jgi:predicted small lipoprotein YifL